MIIVTCCCLLSSTLWFTCCCACWLVSDCVCFVFGGWLVCCWLVFDDGWISGWVGWLIVLVFCGFFYWSFSDVLACLFCVILLPDCLWFCCCGVKRLFCFGFVWVDCGFCLFWFWDCYLLSFWLLWVNCDCISWLCRVLFVTYVVGGCGCGCELLEALCCLTAFCFVWVCFYYILFSVVVIVV